MKTIIKITSIIFIFLGVSVLFFILSQWHTKTHWENATLLNDLQHVDTLDTWAYGFVGNGEFHHAELENFEICWYTGDTTFLRTCPDARVKIYTKQKRSFAKADSLFGEVPMTKEEMKLLSALPKRHRVK